MKQKIAVFHLCKDLQLQAFNNAELTAFFIQKCNNLLDVFNSGNRNAKYFYLMNSFSRHKKNNFSIFLL